MLRSDFGPIPVAITKTRDSGAVVLSTAGCRSAPDATEEADESCPGIGLAKRIAVESTAIVEIQLLKLKGWEKETCSY